MHAIGAESFVEYRERLEADPDEFAQLFNTFLINVTAFFRDSEPWEYLRDQVVPNLLEHKRRFEPIRAWSAGCATGEEAFTVAMVLAEAMGSDEFQTRVKIYATDIDDHALTLARQGVFDRKHMENVPAEMVDRYFEKSNGDYSFRKDLRRAIVFGRHDVLHDAPISRIDLLVCRNTLMYFNAAAQARILARLHFSLTDNGYLFLGRAETLLAHTSTFRPVDLKQRIFSKIPSVRLTAQLHLMTPNHSEDPAPLARDNRLREQALDATGVAQLVIDHAGNLVLINGLARKWFGLSRRDTGNQFHNLELSYRPIELRSLIDQAYKQRRAINVQPTEYQQPSGKRLWLEAQIIPLPATGEEVTAVSVVFTDITAARRLQQALERTSLDFETAAEQLQSANEEMETTNEELQSAVEELETTNEELQASYEELEAMNEELQSTNDELKAMNDVAEVYTTELDTANHLLESIFTGLGSRVIVVDRAMNVTFWNKGAEDLWGIRATEAVNSSLMNLDFGLPLTSLGAPLDRILQGQSERETLDITATNRRGKRVMCHITLAPLLSRDGSGVSGAIILTADNLQA